MIHLWRNALLASVASSVVFGVSLQDVVAADNGLLPLEEKGLVFSRQKLVIMASGAEDATVAQSDEQPKDDKGNVIVYQKDKEGAPSEGEAEKPDVDAQGAKVTLKKKALHAVEYQVDVRDERAYELEWIPSLNYLDEHMAFIVTQEPNNMVNVGMLRTMIPLDIVMVRHNGRILAILPEITLADLRSDIDAGEDVTAVIFLKSGQVKARGIKPNDEVQHKLFELSPKVLR